jgi:hypothetical protein
VVDANGPVLAHRIIRPQFHLTFDDVITVQQTRRLL